MFYCFDKRNKDRHEEALKMLTIYLKSVWLESVCLMMLLIS
jgi:hypothetical protein